MFHKVYDFTVQWYRFTKQFPKSDRYTFGEKITGLLIEILAKIRHAEYQHGREKQVTLIQANQILDTIKILVRLTWTIEIIQEGNYIIAETLLNEMGKMLSGWIRSL